MENKDEAVITPEPAVATDKVKENEVPSTVAASNGPTKSRHREEKSRKKDDKSVEHVLKALNSLESTEEKLAALCKKYTDIFDEHRKLQMVLKQTEKRCSGLQREKEQLQTEHSKAILTRSRLENLCRELQRQNKAIKDENLLKIREEEEKRKEVSAKFQSTLSEITTLMQQNNDKNMKLRDDNIDMTTKLKNVCEQYELREQQVEKIAKQMQLESQLADAKLAKAKMEMAAEKEILLREKQQLLMELTEYQARWQESQATEVSLRNQISLYNDKYDEFQKALERSNNVFGGFKGEMEKMSKKICKLEKETSSWKQRWERSHTALLDMAADKQKSEQELSVAARQLTALQNLCRTLQTERTQLLASLKASESAQTPAHIVEPAKERVSASETNKCEEEEEVTRDVDTQSAVPHVCHVNSSLISSVSSVNVTEDTIVSIQAPNLKTSEQSDQDSLIAPTVDTSASVKDSLIAPTVDTSASVKDSLIAPTVDTSASVKDPLIAPTVDTSTSIKDSLIAPTVDTSTSIKDSLIAPTVDTSASVKDPLIAPTVDTSASIKDSLIAPTVDTSASVKDLLIAHTVDTSASVKDSLIAHTVDTSASVKDSIAPTVDTSVSVKGSIELTVETPDSLKEEVNHE